MYSMSTHSRNSYDDRDYHSLGRLAHSDVPDMRVANIRARAEDALRRGVINLLIIMAVAAVVVFVVCLTAAVMTPRGGAQ